MIIISMMVLLGLLLVRLGHSLLRISRPSYLKVFTIYLLIYLFIIILIIIIMLISNHILSLPLPLPQAKSPPNQREEKSPPPLSPTPPPPPTLPTPPPPYPPPLLPTPPLLSPLLPTPPPPPPLPPSPPSPPLLPLLSLFLVVPPPRLLFFLLLLPLTPLPLLSLFFPLGGLCDRQVIKKVGNGKGEGRRGRGGRGGEFFFPSNSPSHNPLPLLPPLSRFQYFTTPSKTFFAKRPYSPIILHRCWGIEKGAY